MGYKRALISLGASIRRAEANSQRRARQWEREQKAQHKLEELQQAAYEVEQYESEIHELVIVHKECGEPYNWLEISKTAPPLEPVDQKANESRMRKKIEKFKPNILHRIFKTEQKSRAKLQTQLEQAIQKDTQIFDTIYGEYQVKLGEHDETVSLAKQILAGNLEAYSSVVSDVEPFQEITEYVKTVDFKPLSESRVRAVVHLQAADIVPRTFKDAVEIRKADRQGYATDKAERTLPRICLLVDPQGRKGAFRPPTC